jgi:enoyl-CoA hydratase
MLRTERTLEDAVVVWTLDQPRTKNALDTKTIADLTTAAREAAGDPTLRAAILTGAGGVFVSGGDLRELRDRGTKADAEALSDAGFAMTDAIATLPFPTIAALPGAAIGGGAELAIACDMRIADRSARLGFKQVRMGVTTAWGSAARLTALVGRGTAARLLFTAEEIGADEARRVGLVDDVTEDGGARDRAIAWAREIALGSPTAVGAVKRLLRSATEPSPGVRDLERTLFVETWSGPDHQEAVEAWFSRRPPGWRPRSA